MRIIGDGAACRDEHEEEGERYRAVRALERDEGFSGHEDFDTLSDGVSKLIYDVVVRTVPLPRRVVGLLPTKIRIVKLKITLS